MIRDNKEHGGAENSHFTGVQQSGYATELDTIFGLLSCRRCRFTLYCLHDSTGVVELDDLVGDVTTMENNSGPGTVERGSVRMGLCERHLPRLDTTGIIDYDDRSGSIRYRGQPALTEWLEHARYKELDVT